MRTYVTNIWVMAATDRATAIAILGEMQAARPSPIDKWGQPGIGDAEFLPLCIAAGCSPEKCISLIKSCRAADFFDVREENQKKSETEPFSDMYACVDALEFCSKTIVFAAAEGSFSNNFLLCIYTCDFCIPPETVVFFPFIYKQLLLN